MKTEQTQWAQAAGWVPGAPGKLADNANLVLVFGSTELLKEEQHIVEIRKAYPDTLVSGCSTAGEIFDITVSDDSLSVTATTHHRLHAQRDTQARAC